MRSIRRGLEIMESSMICEAAALRSLVLNASFERMKNKGASTYE